MSRMISSPLPYFACGKVVQGFGRGSKTLGCPTANLQQDVVDQLPENFNTGIYFGWAKVDDGPVYPQVTSVGWNPYFKNQTKSMESHILHIFDEDFYGSTLKICLTGYIRDEMDFTSIGMEVFVGKMCWFLLSIVKDVGFSRKLDALKEAIQNDIETTKRELSKPEYATYKDHEFFRNNGALGGTTNGHS